jgi:hypothetical protein
VTSVWQRLSVQDKICQALREVTIVNPDGHHFGCPYVTAYQLAIALDAAHPEIAAELGVEIGGVGTGSHNSLAQYIANQLSTRIKHDGDTFPVEGAFLSNDHVSALTFLGPDGVTRTSSLTDSGYDLSMYRLRTSSTETPHHG